MHIITAVLTGIGILLAGNLPRAGFGPISGLAGQNFRNWVAAPWAIIPMALYLWAYWRFIGGAWGSAATAATCHANLRANGLSRRVWAASLAAGALGFIALLALLLVASRLVSLPRSVPITTPSDMPVITALLLLAMQSIVAGVTEEAAFRGYMQSMIERYHGVAIAVLVNGLFFGLLRNRRLSRADDTSGRRADRTDGVGVLDGAENATFVGLLRRDAVGLTRVCSRRRPV